MTHAVLAFGRMNPPTKGHEKFIKKTHEVAKKVGGKAHVIASHSEGNAKNPIPQKKKLEYIKKIAHPDVHVSGSSKEQPSILHHAAKLHAAGHKHLHVVAAGEREAEFHKTLHKYNGKKGTHGHYNFKSITIHSAGKRDPDAHGTTGISGTKMRQHAHNNDHKSFKAGLPKALHSHKDEIMNHIKTQKEDLDQEFEQLLEAMDIKQRIKRKLIMRRARPKINRMKRLYKKRKVPEKNLVQRARKAGIRFVRKKVAGKKGTQYGKLSAAAKMHIDKKVAKQQRIVNNIAKRLLPRTRKAELVRLQKNEVETAFGDYIEERHKRKDGKAFEIKDTGTQAGNTKHTYKKKNEKGEMGAPVTEQDLHSLFLKSEKGEHPFEVILEVFVRGIEDWDGGSNSPAQYAFNRVNSFIAGGKAYELDKDLVEDSSKRAADQTSNLNRKIGRKSETLRSKQSVSSKSTTLFKRRHGGKTSQHRQDAGMGRSSSAEGDVAHTKRPKGGITKMHKDLKNYSEKDFRRVHGKSKSAARQALAKENYAMVSGATSMTQSKTPPPQRVKKDKAGSAYMKFEGTPEATAHAKKVTPGETNEAADSFYNRAGVTKGYMDRMKKINKGEAYARPKPSGPRTGGAQAFKDKMSKKKVDEAAPLPTSKQTAGADKIKKNLLTKAIKRQMQEKMGMDANTDEVAATQQKNMPAKMKGRIKLYMMPKVMQKEAYKQGPAPTMGQKKAMNKAIDNLVNNPKKVPEFAKGPLKMQKEDLNLSFEQWLEAYSASYGTVRAGTTSKMGAARGKKPSSGTFGSSYNKPVVGDRKQLRDPMKKRKTEVSWS